MRNTNDSGLFEDPGAEPVESPGWVDLTSLQCELRTLFTTRPPNRALAESLRLIGVSLGADYAVVHAQLGGHMLSEEWWKPGTMLDSDLRDSVNAVLVTAKANESVRCTRLQGDEHSRVMVTALIFDGNIEQSGLASLVFSDCSEDDARRHRLCLESIVACLALLVDRRDP